MEHLLDSNGNSSEMEGSIEEVIAKNFIHYGNKLSRYGEDCAFYSGLIDVGNTFNELAYSRTNLKTSIKRNYTNELGLLQEYKIKDIKVYKQHFFHFD
jgi:hypothetical protein